LKTRYSNLNIIGNKFIETFPSINYKSLQRTDDINVKIKSGIRVDQLALQYLGDGKLWYILCLLNNAKTPFDDVFLPGKIIRIPRNINNILEKIK
jgi:hypothetical protein